MREMSTISTISADTCSTGSIFSSVPTEFSDAMTVRNGRGRSRVEVGEPTALIIRRLLSSALALNANELSRLTRTSNPTSNLVTRICVTGLAVTSRAFPPGTDLSTMSKSNILSFVHHPAAQRRHSRVFAFFSPTYPWLTPRMVEMMQRNGSFQQR
ncbi:hypothetical protein LB505_002145 [Fusarium chuoi]|nr:hypothetical protein LB505_002145 [Fusarium chuoi]